MVDVELGELIGELPEEVIVGDVLAQGGGFGGGHAPGVVAAVLPDLEFEIGAEAHGLLAAGRGPLEVLRGESASLHFGEVGELLKDGFTGGGGWRIHRAGILPMNIETVNPK